MFLVIRLESEVNATHKGACGRIRTEVVTRSESSSCKVYVISVITGEGVKVLCRHVKTDIGYIFAEPAVREVIA